MNADELTYWFVSIIVIGVDLKKIDECIGDPDTDEDNAILKAEQDAQVKLDYRTLNIVRSMSCMHLCLFTFIRC